MLICLYRVLKFILNGHLCRVQPERIRVQSYRMVRAIEKMNCIVPCHPTLRAIRRMMGGRVYMVKLGKKERGFIGLDLCK